MSDILDPNEPDYFQVEFAERYSNGLALAYASGAGEVILTRTELQALYGRIQNIMAAELKAAGWRPHKTHNRFFFAPGDYNVYVHMDVAWEELQEGEK
jgi:hypothetical protein